MALSEQDRRNIVEQSSSWIDNGFAGIDLSGFPALQPPPPADTHDDRFAKLYSDAGLSRSASALRKFIADPDVEALERVGSEIGHEDFRDEVRQRRGKSIAQQFKKLRPDYLQTDANYRSMVSTLSFNCLTPFQQQGTIEEQVANLIDGGFWTPNNLVATFDALSAEGLLQVPAGSTRNLSERERLHVMRLAQTGHAQEAIDQFLRFALDEDELSLDLLYDPAYRGALDTAVMFVFEVSTLDYTPDEEWRNFLLRFAANRPLTLNLLTQGRELLKQREASYARHKLLDQFQRPQETPPPSAKEIDALSDEALDDLYHSSLREYAKSIKGAGILA